MSVLDDLAAELGVDVDVLEARLKAPAVDAIAVNYLTQDAAGRTGASFTGHVKASGLDLDGGPFSTFQLAQLISWYRHTDGDRVAEIVGLDDGTLRTLTLGACKPGIGQAIIGAILSALQLQSGADATPGQSWVQAFAQTYTGASSQMRTIIDAAGRSDFAQLAAGLRALTFNNGEVTVPPGFVSVAHGLPRNLAGAALSAHFNGGAVAFTGSYEYPGVDNAHFTIHNMSGTQTNVAWLAWG